MQHALVGGAYEVRDLGGSGGGAADTHEERRQKCVVEEVDIWTVVVLLQLNHADKDTVFLGETAASGAENGPCDRRLGDGGWATVGGGA